MNVEEVGCKPIKIGELYGGGNQAGYSVYGYNADGTPKESGTKIYEDPQVNVKSFTSIGKVFGGGYGSGATMVGNPTVNVNEVYGRYYNDNASVVAEGAKTPGNYPIPPHEKGKMGAINEIFGGGNAAKVIGSTKHRYPRGGLFGEAGSCWRHPARWLLHTQRSRHHCQSVCLYCSFRHCRGTCHLLRKEERPRRGHPWQCLWWW